MSGSNGPEILNIEQAAALLGVSIKTLQNWEQGRREPEGPAKALLKVVEKEPEAWEERFYDALSDFKGEVIESSLCKR